MALPGLRGGMFGPVTANDPNNFIYSQDGLSFCISFLPCQLFYEKIFNKFFLRKSQACGTTPDQSKR
jgi:hypothetical protein